MLAFQPYHSLIEMRRYAVRFMHQLHLIRSLRGILRTKYDQYNSLIRPLEKYLADRGVKFVSGAPVTDMDIRIDGTDKPVTVHDYPQFFDYPAEKTGNPTGKGGCSTFVDAPWFINYNVPLQPVAPDQPENVQFMWFYGLHANNSGTYTKKPMTECSGEEIMREFLYYCGLEDKIDEIMPHITAIPVVMPYITQASSCRAG